MNEEPKRDPLLREALVDLEGESGLRDADALERLPPAEREECRALWQEAADLLRRAQAAR